MFLHLRTFDVVLQVHHFDLFYLGVTEVISTAPVLAHLRGRQYPDLGQAAAEIHIEIYGRGHSCSDYFREYEAYCIGEVCVARLGQGRRTVTSHGHKREVSFSPGELNTPVELAPAVLASRGRWIACGDLLPLVHVAMSDAEASERLIHELSIGSRKRHPSSSLRDSDVGRAYGTSAAEQRICWRPVPQPAARRRLRAGS